MENKDKNNVYYRLLLIAAIIIPVIIGFSYAYFLAVVQGTEDPTTIQGTVIDDLIFDLQTENNGYINATGIFPLNQDEVDTNASRGVFKVVTGDNAYGVTYTLSLTDISLPAELKNEYFKWRLICTSCQDTSKNAEGNFASVTTTLTDLKTNIFIPANSSDTYNLLIWLDNASNVDQTSAMNKSFSAKVQATAEFATTRVPSIYQEVEYIAHTDAQYIDTLVLASSIVSIEIDGYCTWPSSLYGVEGIFNITGVDGYYTAFVYNNVRYLSSIKIDGRHIFKQDKNLAYIDGSLKNTFTEQTFNSEYSIVLFARKRTDNGNIDDYNGTTTIYYAKIWYDNILVRNYIPVKRINDNVVGLYDTVEQKFYTNADSSGDNFVAGPNV